jgi:hypothetical protein
MLTNSSQPVGGFGGAVGQAAGVEVGEQLTRSRRPAWPLAGRRVTGQSASDASRRDTPTRRGCVDLAPRCALLVFSLTRGASLP